MKFLQNSWDILLRAASAGAAALGGVRGGLPVLLLLMAADAATGLVRAAMGKSDRSPDGKWSLRAALTGLMRKLLALLAVYLSSVLDDFASLGGAMRAACLWFYIGHEGLSVLSNLSGMGVPVPEKLRSLLQRA